MSVRSAGPLVRTAAAMSALTAVALLGACGAGEPSAAPTTTTVERTTTTTEPTATTVSPEAEVRVAYEAANDAIELAYDPPDPQHPAILATYTGEALTRLQASLQQLADQGLGARGTVESHLSNVTVDGNAASLTDCFIDRTQFYLLADGQPQGPVEVTTLEFVVSLERVEDAWRISLTQPTEAPCTPS